MIGTQASFAATLEQALYVDERDTALLDAGMSTSEADQLIVDEFGHGGWDLLYGFQNETYEVTRLGRPAVFVLFH